MRCICERNTRPFAEAATIPLRPKKKNGLYGYERTDGKEKITVFLNNQSAAADIPPINGKILWQQGYEEKNNSLAPMGFAVFTQEV